MRSRRRAKSAKWLLNGMYVAAIVMVVSMVVGVGVFAYFARDLPSPDRIVRREGFATKIYDRNGELLYDVFADQRRTPVELAVIPQYVRDATVSIEDKNFYSHSGIDPLAPIRIIWYLISKGKLTGGSGLTQQLVKNVLLSNERTLTRKLKEFILTIQVESKYSKDEILQMYLNEVPYGGTLWGVESASEAYFGKPVSEVNLPEAAILAGLPQSPTRFSPFSGEKLYENRAYDVLERMREDGKITRDQELAARDMIPKVTFASSSGVLKAPHFVFYVKQQLIDRYGEEVVEKGGLKVTTSLDLEIQEQAQKTVSEEIAKVEKTAHITNGASVAMNTKTGEILAMVGSKGWDDPNYDGKFNVTTAGRQPGSSIKPITYLVGLREGYTAATLIMDTKTSFPGGDKPEYVPVNYDGKYRGPVLMREALGNSLNVPAVKMLSWVGILDMMTQAYDMGIISLEPTKENLARVGLSVTLGGGEVKPLELTTAYAAFANGGKRVEPVSILKVTDKDGRILEEWKQPVARSVMTPEEAYIMSSILADNHAREMIFGANSLLNIPNREVAVKTGTTNDSRDNWAIGWTPSYIVGVWVGNNDNSPIKRVASGSSGATPIWRKTLLAILGTSPKEIFEVPPGIVTVDIDRASGYAAHDGFDAKPEVFVKGTEPKGLDPVHKRVKVCKGEGRLAGPNDIANGQYDEKEFFYFKEEDPFAGPGQPNKWQEGILAWLSEQGDSRYHPPTEFCSGSGNQIYMDFVQPTNHSQTGSDVFIKVTVNAPNKIVKMEFFVDGVSRHTATAAPWEVTIPGLSTGNHHLEVKVEDERGNTNHKEVDIGVNQAWQEPTPTPNPSPTPSAAPAPTL